VYFSLVQMILMMNFYIFMEILKIFKKL